MQFKLHEEHIITHPWEHVAGGVQQAAVHSGLHQVALSLFRELTDKTLFSSLTEDLFYDLTFIFHICKTDDIRFV